MMLKKVWHLIKNKLNRQTYVIKNNQRPSTKDNKQPISSQQMQAEIIIKGEILPHKQTIMLNEVCGYTKTKVKIKEVYAGTSHEDDIIELYEPYYEGCYRGKKCIMVHEGYEPLHIGKTYNLLLSHRHDQMAEQSLFYQVS